MELDMTTLEKRAKEIQAEKTAQSMADLEAMLDTSKRDGIINDTLEAFTQQIERDKAEALEREIEEAKETAAKNVRALQEKEHRCISNRAAYSEMLRGLFNE